MNQLRVPFRRRFNASSWAMAWDVKQLQNESNVGPSLIIINYYLSSAWHWLQGATPIYTPPPWVTNYAIYWSDVLGVGGPWTFAANLPPNHPYYMGWTSDSVNTPRINIPRGALALKIVATIDPLTAPPTVNDTLYGDLDLLP